MDIGYIKKLIKLLSDSSVHELEIEEDGKRIRVSKSGPGSAIVPPFQANQPVPVHHYMAAPPSVPALPVEHSTSAHHPGTSAPAAAPSHDLHEVKSPIVGTFYRSPSPDSPVFVEEGSTVSVGTVLCIVEAMKLMNEIESDVAGKIVKILIENGQPVEYGQPLFLVKKS